MNIKCVKAYMPDWMVALYDTLYIVPKFISILPKYWKLNIPNIKFYSDEETVDMIVKEGKSLSRYGDGEFLWMSGVSLNSYQVFSKQFQEDLKRSFLSKNDKLLIGIPIGLFDSHLCRIRTKMWWRIILVDSHEYVFPLLNETKVYANASITRPWIDYCRESFSKPAFENVRRIWDSRDVCIIEGAHTRLGVGNDLFDNANSIVRILAPAVNAYSKKEEIKSVVRSKLSKSTMIIAALGPTASILASELSEEGYQFIDIGHIDVEYMWYLNKDIIRKPIPGKYVNEGGGDFVEDIYTDDVKYHSSIIASIQ